VSFKPARLRFFGWHEGFVEVWNEKGAGKDPVQEGDEWLIREFPRTIPERGAKS